jgi:threonine dehydrogenase-like Zn-dependent dehydrogenase
MKAIVNTAPGKLEFLDLPTPQPGPGQVRIRVAACAICATDLLMIAGWERTGFPSIPGHEWAGIVDAAGPGVDASLVGKKCVAENVWASDGGEVGFEHPGGYAQFLVTDAANVRPLPGDFDLTAAALIEPTAVCVRAMNRLRDDARGPTLIFGDGPIGLILVAMLAGRDNKGDRHRQTAAEPVPFITLVGGRDSRLALARELGAARVVNYHKLGGDLASGIREAAGLGPAPSLSDANRKGFGTVIEASGSPKALEAGIGLTSHLARVLMVGDYGLNRSAFPWNCVLIGELELIGSNASAGGWDQAVRSAATGQVPLAKLVTHTLPAAKFQEGIDLMRSRRDDVIKVVLKWE